MNAANAGTHHSSSSAGSASRRSSAITWFSSDYSGLTELRAGSRQSTVASGYTGLTEMRSASAHGYGSGRQGLFGQAYRSPAVSSVQSVPREQAAPVPAPSTHVSSRRAAPHSPWHVSNGHSAPRLSPSTHARKYVFGLRDYLEEQRQTAGHPEEHPADAMEVEGEYFYEPLSELETPGSHAPSSGHHFGEGCLGQVGGRARHHSSPAVSRHSPRIIRPEDPYVPRQGPPSGESLHRQGWPQNLPAPPRAHDAPMRIQHEELPSPARTPTRSECDEQVRALRMRMERANRRAESGIRYMRQNLVLAEQDYARWRVNIGRIMDEVKEDMASIKRRRPDLETPKKRRRDDFEGSGSSGGSRRRLR